MEIRKILAVLLIAVLITSTRFSATLARYTDAFSGADTALIAKWNMGVRGEDDLVGVFYNKGFTFDLFGGRSVAPMDGGEKSFTFSGGGSDVAIAYDVRMNAADLLELTTADTKATIAGETGKEVYAPFIFRITVALNEDTASAAPTVFSPYDQSSPYYETGWFRPRDIETDEEGYFSIFEGAPGFDPGSVDEVTVTVRWQWNTSFYISDTAVAAVTPPNDVPADPTAVEGRYPPYYQSAYDEYYDAGGLLDRYTAAVNDLDRYLEEHGSPDSDGTWPPHYIYCALSDAGHNAEYAAIDNPDPEVKALLQAAYMDAHGGFEDETGSVVWSPGHTVPCPANHLAEYNALAAAADRALDACRTSLLTAYDDYDTFAADALHTKESAKVLFRVTGAQTAPR